ncbi:helix-turn-helix transcriptional regulator [Erythrobacter litoralis]|uniref:response regulator transcription factor n=1 Tax=Erythrobacter litoralis TaxID=39960 RepID=UPI002435452C|nr:LuxR C-terminal-related transcriptional regulator [Erythrobacter litoralis]MDG6080271.1 helix-turn-helix transcriptional regulator [Erythrobacter litoralis]
MGLAGLGFFVMETKETVHVVAETSDTRAELARTVFSLGHHAEVYSSYDEILHLGPSHGIILAEDIIDQNGAAALLSGMAINGIWCPVIAAASDVKVTRIVEALRAGVVDYLAPTIGTEALKVALERAASHGERSNATRRDSVKAHAALRRLTTRELEVVDLLVDGSRNKEIARTLGISPRTVETYRANVMVKLEAKTFADVIRYRLAARADEA